jgi:hypothetical protein
MNRKAALSRIRIAAATYGSQRKAAQAWNIQPSYLSEVLKDKRGTVALPEYLLERAGLKAIVKTVVNYKEIA